MSLTVLLAVSVLPLPANSMPAAERCRFGNSIFETGDTWYPRVKDRGNEFCTMCKCLQGAKLECKSVKCDLVCNGDSEEDTECCNICREAHLSGPPFARTMTPQVRNGRTSPAPCEHNGNVYSQGETFTSNSSGITPVKALQCVECTCEDSSVRCYLVGCEPVHCPNPIVKPDSCCPACPDSYSRFLNDRLHPAAGVGAAESPPTLPEDMGGPATFTVESPSPRAGRDCISGGKVYPNGAAWHPLMGPFGRMNCEICSCSAGRVNCSRVRCPKPACARPEPVTGQCCPVCAGSKLAGRPVTAQVRCVPAHRVLLVWRSHGGANHSEYIQYIFERPGRYEGKSEKHEWTFSNDTIQTFRVVPIDNGRIDGFKLYFSWEMIGTTTSRRLQKFRRREERVYQRCRAGCSRRVLRVQRKLRLQPPKLRPFCRANEREL